MGRAVGNGQGIGQGSEQCAGHRAVGWASGIGQGNVKKNISINYIVQGNTGKSFIPPLQQQHIQTINT
jgi:hypothetical protein